MKQLLFFVLLCAIFHTQQIYCSNSKHHDSKKVDIVIFSRNRPLQLYAALESIQKFATGINIINVLYKADGEYFEKGYQEVARNYSSVVFWRQYTNKEFEEYLMKIIFETGGKYVCLMVDDDVVTDPIDLSQCANLMEQYSAYSFSPKMGLDRTYNFFSNEFFPGFPKTLKEVEDGVFSWKLSEKATGWDWVHTNDMTIYKKSDIEEEFQILKNKGELLKTTWFHIEWQAMAELKDPLIMCFEKAKMINVVTNLVSDEEYKKDSQFSEEWINSKMDTHSPETLLKIFNANKKIDIAHIRGISSKCNAHYVETEYKYIDR